MYWQAHNITKSYTKRIINLQVMKSYRMIAKVSYIIGLLLLNLPGFSNTDINGGPVSGTWEKAYSPYLVKGNITVPSGSSLTINAGVEVIFQGVYNLVVNGTLELNGAEGDSVIMTAVNATTGWRGIKLFGPFADTIHINYSIIEYVIAPTTYPEDQFGALTFDHVIVKITNSRVSDNKAGEYGCGIQSLNSTLILENNLFMNNNDGYYGGAVRSMGSYMYVLNNRFIRNRSSVYYSNGGAISSEQDSLLQVSGNLFTGNLTQQAGGALNIYNCHKVSLSDNIFLENESEEMGGAICLSNCTTDIINNLICKNIASNGSYYSSGGGGMKVTASEVRIINSTIADNVYDDIYCNGSSIRVINSILSPMLDYPYSYTIYVYDDYNMDVSKLFFDHSIIEKGLATIYQLQTYNIIIQDTIDCLYDSPLFLDRENSMYQTDFNSIAHNNGTLDTTGLFLPLTDLDGNPRIIDDTIDIGAYEFNNFILNRVPKIKSIPDYVVHTGTILDLSVLYTDADAGDTHTLTIYTDNPAVEVHNLSGNTSGSTFSLHPPASGTIASTRVTVVVEDNSGAANAKDSIYFDVFYAESHDFTSNQLFRDQVWETDTIRIFQDVQVNNGILLSIGPGTNISFQGNFKLDVLGQLIANGTESDPINFTNQSDSPGSLWQGIRFAYGVHNYFYTPAVSSKLDYCHLRYAENGLYLYNLDSIYINHCDISHCERGIYCEGGATIRECAIHDNSNLYQGGGLYLRNNNMRKLSVIHCKIYNNDADDEGGGVMCSGDDIVLIGNQIYNNKANSGGGVSVDGAATLINNTIALNEAFEGGGVWQYLYGNMIYQNNILQYNKAYSEGNQIYNTSSAEQFYLYNNYLEGGIGDIYVQPYVTGMTYKHIYSDLSDFVDTTARDFSLIPSSVCINAGALDSILLQDVDRSLLDELTIYDGRIDLGAIEFTGTPDNRLPILEKNDHFYIIPDSTSSESIEYTELDSDDALSVQFFMSSPQVSVENINLGTSSIYFDLVPTAGWKGSCDLIVHLLDKSGIIGESNVDTIKVYVTSTQIYCGTYNNDLNWNADTILINCDVTIGKDAILSIKAGTIINVAGPYSLNIKGVIKAEGSAGDSIRFTSSEGNWGGITILPFDNMSVLRGEPSYMRYCIFENTDANLSYTEGGLMIQRGEFALEHSHIRYNLHTGVSVYYGSNIAPVIFANRFTDNEDGALQIWGSPDVTGNLFERNKPSATGYLPAALKVMGGNPNISSNIFRYNTGGALELGGNGLAVQARVINNMIYSNSSTSSVNVSGINCHNIDYGPSEIHIVGNLIYDNHSYNSEGGGISVRNISYDYVFINNNTIVNNYSDLLGGGVNIGRSSVATLNNNIIWGNTANGLNDQVGFSYLASTTHFNNCAIENGTAGFTGWDIGIGRVVVNKIWDIDPRFNNADLDDYSLKTSSFYIDSGTVDTTGLFLPALDIAGNPRIQFDTVDVGAYELFSKLCTSQVYPLRAEICQGDSLIFADSILTQQGRYYFFYPSYLGCDSLILIDLTVNPLPQIDLGSDTTIIPGEQFVLSIEGSYEQINWSTGSTDNQISITGSDGEEITIWVNVTDSLGCTNSDTVLVLFKEPEIIRTDNNTQSCLKIYPNPASGSLTIELNSYQETEYTISLYEQCGRLVYREQFSAPMQTLDVSGIHEGFYILKLQSGTELIIQTKLLLKNK
jgi:hypothetical protein